MASILAFGGGGQLGRELAARAIKNDMPLVTVGRAEADIADPVAVAAALRRAEPDLVINAAAYTQVDRAEAEPAEAFRTNDTGAGVLAAACAAAKLPLIHISSDFVFDGHKTTPYSERDIVAPIGVYGRSKAAGEKAIRAVLARHIILRTSWVYGIYGSNFLKTILRLSSSQSELRVVADQRGCPTGTADIADAILRIAPRLLSNDAPWGLYHFVGSGVTTRHGFAQAIVEEQAQFTQRLPKVIAILSAEYPTAGKRPANSELDCSLFGETFGFRAMAWRDRVRQVVSQLANTSNPPT